MGVDASSVHIETLGPLQVRCGPRSVNLGTAKQRAVFAALVLHTGGSVTVESLIDSVWGVTPPFSARHLVHTYVARLRQALEPEIPRRRRVNVIGSAPSGYRLLIDPEQVDLTRFERLRAGAHHQRAVGAHERAFDLLGEALRLWRDPHLRHLRVLLPHSSDIDSLRQAWIDAVLDYVSLGLELGRISLVSPLAERLARTEPLHEEAQANYLRTLDRTGRRAAAIEFYHQVRARLKDELGVDPGPRLAAAYRDVLRSGEQDADDRPAPVDGGWPRRTAATALPGRPPWRGHGPGPGELIHREPELESLTGRLAMHRLVTLAGPPGCGKSALALHLAARLRDSYHGVLSADCSDVTDVAELRLRLTKLLAGSPAGDDLTAAIGSQRMLVVLDNVERIVDPCATLVDEIVRACRQVSVLVSSREPLSLPDEAVWRVPPLEVPAPETDAWPGDNPAVELFLRRAAQVRPEFQLMSGNAATVARICRELDGLPLALEMAAACLSVDDLDELVRRLDHPLREIHPLRRGRPSHHQSLSTTFRRSVECLTEPERCCFAQLSRLPAHFRLADARQVCRSDGQRADLQTVLSRLVHKSLLFVTHRPDGPVYRMLNLIHHLAAELASADRPGDRPG